MCGRFALAIPPKRLVEQYHLEQVDVPERHEIAPSQEVLAIRASRFGREPVFLRWGLVPSWIMERARANGLINARCETAFEKPSFRRSIRERRCLLPATAFYEWDGQKRPHLVRVRGAQLFSMAGIWDAWEDPVAGRPIQTCAILTVPANDAVGAIHDRMPLIIQPGDEELWLDSRAPRNAVCGLFHAIDDELTEIVPLKGRLGEGNSPAAIPSDI
jgi:putative SOS response-associated peptidase YedK